MPNCVIIRENDTIIRGDFKPPQIMKSNYDERDDPYFNSVNYYLKHRERRLNFNSKYAYI